MTETSKRDSMEAVASDISSKLATTSLTSSAPQEQPKTTTSSNLTSLPLSIRKSIYTHLLDTELVNLGQPNVSYTHTLRDGILHFQASRSPFPVTTGLFHTNKQVSAEALHHFYASNLFIRLKLYTDDARHAKTMLEESGVLFSVAPPSRLECCVSHAMDMSLVEKGSTQLRAEVMFPAQYLPRLINFWDQASRASKSWANTHALSVELRNTYDLQISRLQGDLLELLRLLTGFGKVDVATDKLLPGYGEELARSMMGGEFDVLGFRNTLETVMDKCEEAVGKKEWDFAVQYAQSGIISMTYGFLTRAEALHSQSEEFFKDIQRLRWKCELQTGTSLLRLHAGALESPPSKEPTWQKNTALSPTQRKALASDLLRAEISLSQALSLATDSPSPTSNPWFQTLPPELIPPNKATWFSDQERGQTWFACGKVHLAVGEPLFAAGDLERAVALCGEDGQVLGHFEKARERIDWSVRPGRAIERVGRLAKA